MKHYWFIVNIIVLLLGNTGCEESNVLYYYYKDGGVFTETYEVDSLYHILEYYSNGVMSVEGYVLKRSNNVEGHFEEYYPDGFPKEKCEMKDGFGIGRPGETGRNAGTTYRWISDRMKH